MNHKYEQRTICPNGEIRTRTIDANELVDLLLQMHFLKQSGEQLMLESNANDENGWAWNQIKVTRGKTGLVFPSYRLKDSTVRKRYHIGVRLLSVPDARAVRGSMRL